MDKFYEVSEDTKDQFFKVFETKVFVVQIGIQFIGAKKQKSLIKISKLPDQYAFVLEKDLLVSINEDLLGLFDEESIKILIEQEIDKVFIDIQSGKIKMIKPDLNTFTSLIKKYGIDKISRANQLETLTTEQLEDKEEFTF